MRRCDRGSRDQRHIQRHTHWDGRLQSLHSLGSGRATPIAVPEFLRRGPRFQRGLRANSRDHAVGVGFHRSSLARAPPILPESRLPNDNCPIPLLPLIPASPTPSAMPPTPHPAHIDHPFAQYPQAPTIHQCLDRPPSVVDKSCAIDPHVQNSEYTPAIQPEQAFLVPETFE